MTKRKVTPLHFACYAGRVKNAEILLEKAKSSKKKLFVLVHLYE